MDTRAIHTGQKGTTFTFGWLQNQQPYNNFARLARSHDKSPFAKPPKAHNYFRLAMQPEIIVRKSILKKDQKNIVPWLMDESCQESNKKVGIISLIQ